MKTLKNIQYHTVPWFNAAEWHKVHELTYGPSSDIECKREALQILLVWRSRSSELPAPVDCTLSLLEVDLHEYQKLKEDESTSDHALRLLYSAAMIRFINLMLDESDNGLTLLQAAAKHQLPRWIVNLRHEAAHGRDLPSLPALRQATTIALNWLNNAYWIPQSSIISDFYTKVSKLEVSEFEEKMSSLISAYNTVSVLVSDYFNFEKIGDLNDAKFKKDLVKEIKECSSKISIDDEVKLKTIQNQILKLIRTFIVKSSNERKKEICIDLLVHEKSFFLCTDIISIDDESDLNNYMNVWESLLNMFYDNDVLVLLVKKLLNLVGSEKYSEKVRNLGALWINYIAFSLQKTLFVSKNLKSQDFPMKNIKKQYKIAALIEKYPKYRQGMVFDISKPIPMEICSLNFLKEAIDTHNPFLHKYTENLINLIQPPISNTDRNTILRLINIMNPNNNKLSDTEDSSYSVKNIKDVVGSDAEDEVEDIVMENPWEVESSDYNWGECPLGLLPWQMNVKNEVPSHLL